MNSSAKPFVHILLFECSRCAGPVPAAVASDHKSMEHVDSRFVELACTCGWSAKVPATDAKRHWVDSWSSTRLSNAD